MSNEFDICEVVRGATARERAGGALCPCWRPFGFAWLGPPAECGQCEPPSRPSAEQIAVRAGALKADVCAFFGEGINQQPIRFDMAIAAVGEISAERMILALRRQRIARNQSLRRANFGAIRPPRRRACTSLPI